MKSKYCILLATFGVAATLLLVTASAGHTGAQGNKLEGSWIAKVPGTALQWSYVMTPIDPSGRRAALSLSLHVRIPGEIMPDSPIPPVDYFTPFVGEAVMTGPNTAKFTGIGYGMKKVIPSDVYPFFEKVVYTCISSGEIKFTGPGKSEVTHHIADYSPDADTNGDGLPDAAPFVCLPPTTTLDTRVGLMPPCMP